MADRRPGLDEPFAEFGIAALVMPAGGAPMTTEIIWEEPWPQRAAVEMDFTQEHTSARCAMRRDRVPTLPVGSTIQAPTRAGGISQLFTVDRVDDLDADVFRAVVH